MAIFSKKEEENKVSKPAETPVKEISQNISAHPRRIIITKPWMSEKAHRQMGIGQYTFLVDRRATKNDVKKAVEKKYGVNVVSVDTLPVRGKAKRFRGISGSPKDRKKAMVTIQSGQTIEEGF